MRNERPQRLRGRRSSYGAPANEGNEHDRAFPRRNHARVLLISFTLQCRGRREGQASADACGPPAQKNAGGRYHRYSRTDPAFPARSVLTVSFVLSLGIGLSCPHRSRVPSSNSRELDLSVERPGPHDFAVRAGQALVWRSRHVHRSPPPRIVTTRTSLCMRRVERDDRPDLPDMASAQACGRVTRRAVCAWRACGDCPSGRAACLHELSSTAAFCCFGAGDDDELFVILGRVSDTRLGAT